MNDAVKIELNDYWRRFVNGKLESGAYRSTEELLTAALCLLEAEEAKVDRLAALLDEGERSGDWAPWDYVAFKAEMRARAEGREAG